MAMKDVRRFVASIVTVAALGLAAGAQAPTKNVMEAATALGNLKELCHYLSEVGLSNPLKAKGPFTLFAPTDEAFAKLSKGMTVSLGQDKELLKRILTYHMVQGKLLEKDLAKLAEVKTVNGSMISIAMRGGKVSLGRRVRVTRTDILATNGVIHIIDAVLMPPAQPTAAAPQTARPK